ncbi:MAG: site-specific integrase [Lachnospiraceae bacterium]|nr:site-specific integrase [Lachnospiraceae bacterium]
MGEIRTRKRGKYWEYSFEGARINGKRHPISKSGFRTKTEALQAGTQAKAEYDNTGRSFSPATMSVSDYMDYWYDNYVTDLSYSTQQDYGRKIRLHIKPVLGSYRLSALEPDTIQRWIDEKKRSGYSKSMVKNLLCCLSGALDYAVVPCKYISSNPCHFVKVPKIPVDKTRQEHTEYICTLEDYASILERFPRGSNFHLPIVTGYHLGTRIGETYGFDLLHDIDFNAHTISVTHQLKKENKTWFYRSPKYDSCRKLIMDQKYEALLKEEIHNRKKNMFRYGEYYTKTYLLPDQSILQARTDMNLPYQEIMPISVKENGELLTPESFKYCARVIHEELGLVNFHSHCLRHTHGTILAENGAQPKTIMERLGHKDVSTTMNRYIFNTEKMQQDAVDIFVKATS